MPPRPGNRPSICPWQRGARTNADAESRVNRFAPSRRPADGQELSCELKANLRLS